MHVPVILAHPKPMLKQYILVKIKVGFGESEVFRSAYCSKISIAVPSILRPSRLLRQVEDDFMLM
jgi:hypothetical protein